MEDTPATQTIRKPDGSESLVLRRALVTVLKGPDRGAELLVDRPRTRIGTGGECDLVLGDPAVSRRHAEISVEERGFVLRDLDSTNGTLLGGARLGEVVLTGPATLVLGGTTVRFEPRDDTVEIPLSARGSFGGLIGQSLAMRRVFAVLEQVAPSDSTILLTGETGTGKEVAAEAIHHHSPRRDGPLVVVDCGAIPATLIESELFGHERGAFTGAQESRRGALEQADGGTLFLDEVGELPPELQPRLLGFLERQQVKRIGAPQPRQVSVRVIVATNRALAHEVKKGTFRRDLYYRMAVVQVELPPLRERPEDVLLLAHHFAEAFARDPRSILSDEIAALLVAHRWPGNVRELRNVVERLAVVPDEALGALRQGIGAEDGSPPGIGQLVQLPFHEARRRWQDLFERQYINALLDEAGRVVTHAATRAGLPRQTFHRLMRRHGLATDS